MAKQNEEVTQIDVPSDFRPVEGGTKSTDVGLFFGLAYCVFWLLLFAFLLAGWRRQRSLADRLERVERQLTTVGEQHP